MRVAVIIVCAGKGKRLGKKNKALLNLGNQPLLSRSFEVFKKIKQIRQIVLVASSRDFNRIRKIAGRSVVLVAGGKERKDSVFNGLKALNKDISHVLVHDAARPFVKKATVLEIIKQLKKYPGVICGINCPDTLKVTADSRVKTTLKRKNVFLAQTPQGFHKETLLRGFRKFKKRILTDEAQVLELMGKPVKIIQAQRRNFKITYPEDVDLARKLISKPRKKIKIGLGFDVHKISKIKKSLVLGGAKIPSGLSLEAVSDGDLVLHSAADAICGAAGLGDIGDYFPPQNSKNRGLDSQKILRFILRKANKKYSLRNLDIIIVSDKPPLAGHKKVILKSLKRILGISAVNLKIKSKEGLGILGAKNSMSCLALAVMNQR